MRVIHLINSINNGTIAPTMHIVTKEDESTIYRN